MNCLYISFSSFNQLFSHWSDELSLLQIRSLIIRQLDDISSHSDSFLRRQLSSFRNVWLHWDQIIRDIRVIFDDELRFWFVEINILSNSMLFDQLLKLFYSQMIILWDQHDHEEIRDFLVHNWRDDMISIRLFQYEDLFSRSTSDKSFYSSWWIAIRPEFFDEDLLWSSFTDLLIDATAKRKFYWLLASDEPGS
jgi:hypothetical protein